MRYGWIVGISLILLGSACKKQESQQSSGKPGLEAKLEQYLNQVVNTTDDLTTFTEQHKMEPSVVRESEPWSLKSTETWEYFRTTYKMEHEVGISGIVITTGGTTPAVVKGIKIRLHRGSIDKKNDKYTMDTLSLHEADELLKLIDLGIKATNQLTRGGADSVYITIPSIPKVALKASCAKDIFKADASPEWKLKLEVNDNSIPLRSGDWMELKLKIEAAKKWVDTQSGDAAFFAPEQPKK